MPQEKQFKREAARKSSVSEILAGSFTESSEGPALSINGTLTKRVNILATIVDKGQSGAYRSMILDDGTGQIQLRFFDNEGSDGALFEKPEIGNFSLVIGRLRNYGNQTYISPEIIRKLGDVKWAEVRQLELKAAGGVGKSVAKAADAVTMEKDIVSKDKMEIYTIVKQLDTERGADIGEVTLKAKSPNSEATIKEMIKTGDLFEILPGKLKVLE